MELCPHNSQDGAFVIMMKTKHCKINYSDAYSWSNRIICSLMLYHAVCLYMVIGMVIIGHRSSEGLISNFATGFQKFYCGMRSIDFTIVYLYLKYEK